MINSTVSHNGKLTNITLPNIDIYISYDTPIAFWQKGVLTIRENDWSTTTGTHLNSINRDHSKRIDGREFMKLYDKAVRRAVKS